MLAVISVRDPPAKVSLPEPCICIDEEELPAIIDPPCCVALRDKFRIAEANPPDALKTLERAFWAA
jgi:hypothetical protein